MPRTMTPAVLAAIQSEQLRPAIFVQANFVSGPLYVWTGIVPTTWNGQTWTGVGNLGSISTIEEGTDVLARGMTLNFGGFDPTLLSEVLGEFQVGLPVTVWLGLYDATGVLIPDPIVSFAGRMDQPTVQSDGQTATITINCENRLIDLNTPVDRRYTDQDQKLDYPSDRGLEFVNSIQEVNIWWGRVPTGNNA